MAMATTAANLRLTLEQIRLGQATAELKLLEAEARAHEAVGAYLADVAVENGRVATTHFREAFRAKGPSNYDHGKQTELK